MSKDTTPIYKKALEEEHAMLASLLDACLTGDRRQPVELVLTAEDLDRQSADKDEAELIDQIAGNDKAAIAKQCLQIAAHHANMQEDQRIRRDTKIARLNHKRLMLSCLKTMYWRKHDLETSLDL